VTQFISKSKLVRRAKITLGSSKLNCSSSCLQHNAPQVARVHLQRLIAYLCRQEVVPYMNVVVWPMATISNLAGVWTVTVVTTSNTTIVYDRLQRLLRWVFCSVCLSVCPRAYLRNYSPVFVIFGWRFNSFVVHASPTDSTSQTPPGPVRCCPWRVSLTQSCPRGQWPLSLCTATSLPVCLVTWPSSPTLALPATRQVGCMANWFVGRCRLSKRRNQWQVSALRLR